MSTDTLAVIDLIVTLAGGDPLKRARRRDTMLQRIQCARIRSNGIELEVLRRRAAQERGLGALRANERPLDD